MHARAIEFSRVYSPPIFIRHSLIKNEFAIFICQLLGDEELKKFIGCIVFTYML